jgi:hypothetical protein
MPARLGGYDIGLKRNGRRIGVQIERVLFGTDAIKGAETNHRGIIGFVNYKSLAHPVYRDEAGLFIDLAEEGYLLGRPLGSWRYS